jgi:predicted phage terminase large subunit-like protein
MEIRPQKGFQESFLKSAADIVIGGGAAGCGKTYALLMEPLYDLGNRGTRTIFLRRTREQIRKPGAAWDQSVGLYPAAGAVARSHVYTWDFKNDISIQMNQLEYEATLHDYDGAQIPIILFDQLEQFTKKMFVYMLTRNRSASAARPRVRGSANPVWSGHNTGGWLRVLLDFWIGGDGLPDLARAGVVRYITAVDGEIVFVDKDWRAPGGTGPKSITFIPGRLFENRKLLDNNPQYYSNLLMQDRITRARLLDGNWDVSYDAGMFDGGWFRVVEMAPRGIKQIRYWDRAATAALPGKDPDWTAGALCGIYDGELYILDMRHFRESPAENERRISQAALIDGRGVEIGIEQEPGSAGKDTAAHYQTRVLAGYDVFIDAVTGSKVERAAPWCALAEQGHVKLLRGNWNHDFIEECANFPNGKKDQVDAVSGAYKKLTMKDRSVVRAARMAF